VSVEEAQRAPGSAPSRWRGASRQAVLTRPKRSISSGPY